jgi:hypothetical protein
VPKLASDQLHTRTQKAALQVLQREERNAKLSRLEALLVQQFTGKYGSKQQHSAINTAIQQSIHDFLESFVNVADAERQLDVLERTIRTLTESLKDQMREDRKARQEVESSRDNNMHSGSSHLRDADKGTRSVQDRVKSLKQVEWPLVTAVMSTVTEEELKQKQKQEINAQRMQFRNRLDEQIQVKQQRKEESDREKSKALQTIRTELEELEHEQTMARYSKEERFRKEREMRLNQIAVNKAAKDREREQRIVYEQYEMARAKLLANEEEDAKQLIRDKQRQAQEQLLLDNEENKRLREQAQREKFAYEKRLTEEFE